MSRHRPVLVALILGAILASPAAAQQPGIHWLSDIENAKKQARESNRLVLVHFWTQTCGPCKMLEQNVFNQAGVGAAVEAQYVPVKLNADENSATAAGFGITRVPTDIIITPDGEVVGRMISPPTPSGYVAELSKIASNYSTRPGHSFAQAAAAAPVPAFNERVNSAYANLAVGPGAAPAGPTVAPAIQAAAMPNRYGTAGPTGATQTPVGVAMAASVPIQPAAAPPIATPQAAYAALLPQQPQANGYGASAPTAAAPQIGTPAPALTQLAAPQLAPPQLTPPAIVGNRYANVAPAESTPPQIAAPPIAPVATPAIAPAPTAPNRFANPYSAAPPQMPTAVAPMAPFSAPPVGQPFAPPTVTEQPPAAPPVAASAAQDSRKLPAGAPPLGFDGYCPVSMRKQWKWVPGSPQYGIIHRGRTYWFAGPEEQKQFWENPDHYSPALSGLDPVLAIDHKQQVSGRREHSLDYDNLFYLFSSEATLQQFAANPERYATGVRQAMNIERGRFTR